MKVFEVYGADHLKPEVGKKYMMVQKNGNTEPGEVIEVEKLDHVFVYYVSDSAVGHHTNHLYVSSFHLVVVPFEKEEIIKMLVKLGKQAHYSHQTTYPLSILFGLQRLSKIDWPELNMIRKSLESTWRR